MSYLAPVGDICQFTPQWFIEIHSTKYSWQTAKPTQEEGAFGLGFNPLDCGWIRLGCGSSRDPLTGEIIDKDIRMYDINIKWSIRDKPTGQLVIDTKDKWWLGIDIVGRPVAAAFYPKTPDTTVLPVASPIIFYVNTINIENCRAVGTVSVEGVLSSGLTYTETLEVNGDGVYITHYYYKELVQFDVDFEDDINNGGLATVSVWAKTNPTCGIREVRIWCDANEDDWYGCVFGGYIKARYGEINYDDMKTCYDLVGYAEALQMNEYVAGYRATFRCKYFSSDGQFGDCTNATYKATCFRQGASTCYIGDWKPFHHNGESVTDAGYTCPGYEADYTQRLATDGWTYDPNYAPSTDPRYAWYPYDYYLALQGCCDMINSMEADKPASRPFSLPICAQTTLANDIDDSTEFVSLDWDRRNTLTMFKENSFIECEGEIMLIRVGTGSNFENSLAPISRSGTTIGVTRGVESSLKTHHHKGAIVNIPLVCWSTFDEIPPRLVINNILREPELKHTIMDTLESYVEQASTQIHNAPYVAWVDCYRQIQFTELDPDRPTVSGFDDYLEIKPEDIIEPPTYYLSGVVNRVYGQVDIDDSNWIYAEYDVTQPGLESYVESIKLFGLNSEEVSRVHLTALQPTAGCSDFTTYAVNYLKLMSFPHLIEHIAVYGFSPDEHFWEHVTDVRIDQDDHRYDPYLRWTDPINQHINILGMKVKAPDFWKGKDSQGYWQTSDFIVEGVRWICVTEGRREFITYLELSRPTDPAEWNPSE